MKKEVLHYFILLLLLCGCKNQDAQKEDESVQKMDSLIKENKKLNERVSEIDKKDRITDETVPALNETKYAYVLFTVIKKEFNPDKMQKDLEKADRNGVHGSDEGFEFITYFIATDIRTFFQFNDDIKYKFIDDAQSTMNKDIFVGQNIVSIKKRECMVFDTYKDASISRSKYITDVNK